MKNLFLSAALIFASAFCHTASAQEPTEGTSYFLPRTVVKFTLLIEKTSFTPGEYAKYSELYMKMPVKSAPETNYRIIKTSMSTVGMPDSAKMYKVIIDKKHSILSVNRDENGVLMAINAKPNSIAKRTHFVAAPKPEPLNPKDYMNQDILSAGSSAKMAELTAKDIYEIRESRNQLSRGEADFMPKDGEQLKIMLSNLNTQEKALMQVFEGATTSDTTEVEITFIPTKEVKKQLLFRFSKKLGFTDIDDMAGAPYYISVEDKHVIPEIHYNVENVKKSKEDIGITVNMPGKIDISLYKEEQPMEKFELYAAQFGRTEDISGALFGKNFTTHLVLNPITGNVESIDTESLK